MGRLRSGSRIHSQKSRSKLQKVRCSLMFPFLPPLTARFSRAMRRKHGIPDTDCRPFAVAYAAANRARAEREANERNKLAGHVPSVSDHRDSEHRNAPTDAPHGQHNLRRRLPESVGGSPITSLGRTWLIRPLHFILSIHHGSSRSPCVSLHV